MIYEESEVKNSINEKLIEKLVDKHALVGLNLNDIKAMSNGRKGIAYEGIQESESNEEFIQAFFRTLIEKQQVKNCTHILISIGFTESHPLLMENMDIIHDFIDQLDGDDKEIIFGVNQIDITDGLYICAVCVK